MTREWLTQAMVVLLLAFAGPVNAGNVITYYHNDVLGSPVAATDDQGQVMWRAQYRPYGERVQTTADSQAAADNSRWYAGHVFDEETGLSYMGARYYDPKVGRFMGIDPQPFSDSNVQSFGRYTYANNNPYSYVDPDGELPVLVAIVLWNGAKAAAENIVTQRLEMALGMRSSFSYGELATESAIGAISGPLNSARTTARITNVVSKAAQHANDVPTAKLTRELAERADNVAGKKQVGSYTNTHASGKKYHGKGTEDRMNLSAKEKAAEYNDPVVEQDFTPAANSREAFKDEARRIRADGGVENPNNYNKINSPGEKDLPPPPPPPPRL